MLYGICYGDGLNEDILKKDVNGLHDDTGIPKPQEIGSSRLKRQSRFRSQTQRFVDISW